jgi:large repetitive protein
MESFHLPYGLSINSTGQITGTIGDGVDGTFHVTVTATDTVTGASTSQEFTWTVSLPTVTVSDPGNQTNVICDAVDVTFTSSDSDGYPLTFSASGLPAGLSINSSTGAITGTIPLGAVGTYTVAVTAADNSSGVTDIVPFTWTINPATPTVTWTNPSSITFGTALSSTQLDATANVAGTFSYTLADGASANGAVLSAGEGQVLNVTFTPTDTADYTTTTAQVQINVDAPAAVVSVGATTSNTTYTAGQTVYVTATFSEAVFVSGTLTLALNSGGTAYYTGGSGTSTLTFAYTVASGNNSADLNYTSTSALALSGGGITDANGASALLTLPAMGTSSLLADDIVIFAPPPPP